MPSQQEVQAWVLDQHQKIGYRTNGTFIGKKPFTEKLVQLKPQWTADIQLFVKRWQLTNKDQYRPPQAKKTNAPKNSSQSPSVKAAAPKPSAKKSTPVTSTPAQPPSTPSDTMLHIALNAPTIVASQESSAKAMNPKITGLKASIAAHSSLTDRTLQKPYNQTSSGKPTLEKQLCLLHRKECKGSDVTDLSLKNAVLFSASTLRHAPQDDLPQYGLLGEYSCEQFPSRGLEIADPRLFLNTNIPFSAFICGVQGSGKSYTTSCLIENCLLQSSILGVLHKPLSALVFHYDNFASRSTYNPSEIAFHSLANEGFPGHPTAKSVTILVASSNYVNLKELYTNIPSVQVRPFLLKPSELDISTILTLMAVEQTEATPLYINQVTQLLRSMATEQGGNFDYLIFRQRLKTLGLDPKQTGFLNQRLQLLDSFLDFTNVSSYSSLFEPGTITIVDLSCPFVDSNTACVLFKIALGKYLESSTAGKLIVLDEAHKYMMDSPASKALVESLLTVIRQQRHYGCRLIISTQEPTISPRLIDLCTITIVHRFTSPDWFNTLKKHIMVSERETHESEGVGLLRKIMNLSTGEAIVFAPTAVLGKSAEDGWLKATDALLMVAVRKRVTWDGGRSVDCI